MTVIEKAHELGKMLAEGEEFKRLRAADEAQKNDPDAQLLLMNYNRRREQLMAQAQQENVGPDEMQQIRNDMEAEFAKLRQNANIMEFIAAMDSFNGLMQQVNYTVTSYVSPQQEGGCGDSCGGDCGGCSGCH